MQVWKFAAVGVNVVSVVIAQVRVELPFTVGNELGEVIALVVGVDERATDRIDTSLGEWEIPPMHPPQDVFHAALRLYDSVDGEWKWTYRDLRPLGRRDTFAVSHRLLVQRGKGDTIILRWAYPLPEHIDSAVLTDRVTGTLVRIPFGAEQQGRITNKFLEEFVLTVWYRFGPSSVPDGERQPTPRYVVLYDLLGRLCWRGEEFPKETGRGIAAGIYVGWLREAGQRRHLLWVQPP